MQSDERIREICERTEGDEDTNLNELKAIQSLRRIVLRFLDRAQRAEALLTEINVLSAKKPTK